MTDYAANYSILAALAPFMENMRSIAIVFLVVTNRNKTGTSQVGAMSKGQIKSKGAFGDKKIEKKVAQCRNNRKRGPFSPVRFCRLRLKSKKSKGDPSE